MPSDWPITQPLLRPAIRIALASGIFLSWRPRMSRSPMCSSAPDVALYRAKHDGRNRVVAAAA
jgi:hypothetical protein